MTDQFDEIVTLMSAVGYEVTTSRADEIIDGRRRTEDGRVRFIVHTPGASGAKPSADIVLERLRRKRRSLFGPKAVQEVVLGTPMNLGSDFLARAKDLGVRVRSFPQFFDTVFVASGEGADLFGAGDRLRGRRAHRETRRHARGLAAKTDIDVEAARKALLFRAGQPFIRRAARERDAGAVVEPRDLAEEILDDLRDGAATAERPRLFIIVGPAGGGKTELTTAILQQSLDRFNAAKAGHRFAQRPLPVKGALLEFGEAGSGSELKLFDAVMRSMVGAPLTPPILDALVQSGRLSLLFDGLDEFVRGQPDFFPDIERRFLQPGARSVIIMAARDVLLATNPDFSAFVDRALDRADVDARLYELPIWSETGLPLEQDPRREMVWLRVERRRPEPDQPETPATEAMLDWLGARSDGLLWRLSALPLFCDALLQHAADAAGKRFETERQVLDFLVSRMIKREWEKHVGADKIYGRSTRDLLTSQDAASLTRASVLDTAATHRTGPVGLLRVLSELAFQSAAEGRFESDRISTLMRSEIGREADSEQARFALRQFGLFAQDGSRLVRFSHPIIRDYLAADYASHGLASSSMSLDAALRSFDPDLDARFYRFLAESIVEGEDAATALIASTLTDPDAESDPKRRALARDVAAVRHSASSGPSR